MKNYFKFFKIPFIIFAVFLILGISCKMVVSKKENVSYVRGNTECLTEERVFDYADKLTEEEETALREKIAQAELFCGSDIIVVTLEESLEEYAKSYEAQIGPVEPYQYTMVYADNFYDEHKFGFDAPHGDGVILLDNWYREADGRIYSWMSTSGKVYEEYSSEMIDETLDTALENVDEDPAFAYGMFVDMVSAQMGPYDPSLRSFATGVSWVVGIIAAVIFYFVNYGGRKGKNTVETTTYVKGGKPQIREKQDIFITKTVTRRKIETSSGGSGGGGGHISAGGHTHGGGGHSR